MVYQIVQDSPWHNIFGFGGPLLLLALVAFVWLSKLAVKLTIGIFAAGFTLVIASLVGVLVVGHQDDARNDASFSQQLMDEYHVTSSRSLYEIKLDFSRFNEATTVFTQDGKDTPVFIKRVTHDDKQITMAFTVLDDKALYPKPSK